MRTCLEEAVKKAKTFFSNDIQVTIADHDVREERETVRVEANGKVEVNSGPACANCTFNNLQPLQKLFAFYSANSTFRQFLASSNETDNT